MARLLSAAVIVGIYWALGWQGIIGAVLALSIFHVAYHTMHGHWFGE